MDNITHTVTALAVGELLHRALPPELEAGVNNRRRLLLLLSCSFASNLPDLDLVLVPLLPPPLGYLLMHRGHTHTLLYVLPQALLLALGFWFFWPAARRLVRASQAARRGLGLSLGLGLILHLAFDFLNVYGIHPFYPFDSHWYFGDMVFIVEPFFWCTVGIAAVMSFRTAWLKLLAVGGMLGVVCFAAVKGLIPWPSFAVLTVFALGLGILQYRAAPRALGPLLLSLGLGLCFVLLQGYASSRMHERAVATLSSAEPEFKILDIALSPLPANPFCWTFQGIAVSRDATTYSVRSGVLSLMPSSAPCQSPLVRKPELAYGILEELQKLSRDNCHVAAWLRFARVPYIGAGTAIDLRYGTIHAPGGFTALHLENFKDKPCPDGVPGWIPPREDLL